MHGLRGDVGVVAPLRAVFLDAEPLCPSNAGVAAPGQPQRVGDAAKALPETCRITFCLLGQVLPFTRAHCECQAHVGARRGEPLTASAKGTSSETADELEDALVRAAVLRAPR